jgi:hypothetical protein
MFLHMSLCLFCYKRELTFHAVDMESKWWKDMTEEKVLNIKLLLVDNEYFAHNLNR